MLFRSCVVLRSAHFAACCLPGASFLGNGQLMSRGPCELQGQPNTHDLGEAQLWTSTSGGHLPNITVPNTQAFHLQDGPTQPGFSRLPERGPTRGQRI